MSEASRGLAGVQFNPSPAMNIVRIVAAAIGLLAAGAAGVAAQNPPHHPEQQIAELRRELARHDALYHRQAAPEISDFEYDQLKRRLAALERAHPEAAKAAAPLAEIGDDRSGLFQAYRHRERMLSLEKAYTEAELRAFHARVAKALSRADFSYTIEPKYDGLAVSLTYENGRLVRAVTRGNGTEGDDITAHASAIAGLPRTLTTASAAPPPRVVEIRGEIFVAFAEFARINNEREAAGEARFANARNLAAGTMRQLDSSVVAQRGVRLVCYAIGACEPLAALPPTQHELHGRLRAWGLPVIEKTWRATGADELVRAIETLQRARGGFDFPTDGAVVKLDRLDWQRELGAGESAPRWAVAYKFAPERAETQVRAITVQVGRTGVLTPVAELVPVQLGGSTVSRATLHNRDEIARRDLRVGDFVYVEKAGEIIPAVVGVNHERRPALAPPFVFPAECPECRAPVGSRAGEVAVRCTGNACPAQLRRRLEHFASKGGVDIDGLGPVMIEALVATGLVKALPDLYRLTRAHLLTLPRTSAKSAEQLLAAIEASKRAELWRFVHGLGISGVGTVAEKELARKHRSLAEIAAAEPAQRSIIEALLAAGVQPVAPVAAGAQFAGKTFVLTGTLPTLTRAQASAKIEAAGGKVAANVSRTTSYVVAGTEAGAKLEQARAHGIAVLDEGALLRLLAEQ